MPVSKVMPTKPGFYWVQWYPESKWTIALISSFYGALEVETIGTDEMWSANEIQSEAEWAGALWGDEIIREELAQITPIAAVLGVGYSMLKKKETKKE